MLTAGEDKGERGRFIPAKTKVAKADFSGLRPSKIGGPFFLYGSHAMRVAIYARVSTDDRGQDPENQLRELRDWVINSGHIISREYVDYESGRNGAEKRKQFAALFDDATKRKFDCLLFWALDRFSREGMAQTIIHLQRLSSYDVAFHSYTEPHLATDNELGRNILLALLSSLAKVEAQKISERTKAGMARAKAKGMKIGRPKLARRDQAPFPQIPHVGNGQSSQTAGTWSGPAEAAVALEQSGPRVDSAVEFVDSRAVV